MTIGFIGCGNMASAIMKGIHDNLKQEFDIIVYDVYSPASENAHSKYNAAVLDDEIEVAKNSDILFLAVKPNVIESVLQKISSHIDSKTLLVSIAAGKTIEFLESKLSNQFKIVRVMPNINAKVGEAISAYCSNSQVDDLDKNRVEQLLSCFGKCMALDESEFALFGVLGGCAPAFSYMFIDALARAGVKNGMKKDKALKIAAQTVLGSAKMILEGSEHPWELIDNVCSPGGTTIEGVISLQADGFESAVHNAVDKSLDKDKKL